MMAGAVDRYIACAALMLLLVGALAVASPVQAQMGWAASVEQSAAQTGSGRTSPSRALAKAARSIPAPRAPSLPPVPKMKPPAPASAPVVRAAVPSGKAEPIDDDFHQIVTGSIGNGAAHVPPGLDESARLFADDGTNGADFITTGSVDAPNSDLAKGYCVAISNAAADARLAVQRSKLTEMEQQIAQRIAALEQRTAELRDWVERRDAFLKRANASLVNIYAQMEPDSAAPQLVEMDEETAASLLLKLEPQNASAILNEMVPDKAARLAATIAGSARQPKKAAPRKPASPPATPGVAQPVGEMPAQAYPSGGRS